MKIAKYLSYGTMAVLIAAMMAATVLEKTKGTPAAFDAVYHSIWFIVLWAVAAISGLYLVIRRGLPRKPASFGLHIALAIILAGALVTHLLGESGSIHLRSGEAGSSYEKDDGTEAQLPFSIRLDSFSVDYHEGSRMPSDYRSDVSIGDESFVISMNNILKYKGYRFYQADYDEDLQGSILAVSHDPWGVGITYTGYILLLICMIGYFFQKDSVFRSALGRLGSFSSALLVLMILPSCSADGDASVRQALGDLYVYHGHRVCPYDAVVLDEGAQAALDKLGEAKIFPLKDSAGVIKWYSSRDDLPESVYEDADLWAFLRKSPEVASNAVLRDDTGEAVTVLAGIRRYQEREAGSILPPDSKFKAEKIYYRIALPKAQFMLCLGLGLLLFVFNCVSLSRRRRLPLWVIRAASVIALLLLIYLSVVIGLRWWISGTGPYVGKYSVMMLMAWLAMLAVVLLSGKMPLVQPLGFLVAGFTMLLASKAGFRITPLMPVLQSPLLSIHVLSMMLSYTLFGLVAFNGIMGLAVHSKDTSLRLKDLSLVLLYPAVFLLTFGTFLGAVWANISWGSYWAWDPKETWALVTMLVYSFTLHGDSLKVFFRPRFFHWYTVIAFLCVLITYFGVNILLGGMHSYA